MQNTDAERDQRLHQPQHRFTWRVCDTQLANDAAAVASLAVHSAVCDGCEASSGLRALALKRRAIRQDGAILGTRFKSAIADDFDLCASCEMCVMQSLTDTRALKAGAAMARGVCPWALMMRCGSPDCR